MPKEKSRAQVNGSSLLVCMQGMVIMLSTLIARVNSQPCEPMNPPNNPFVIENVHGENRFRVHKVSSASLALAQPHNSDRGVF